MNVYKLKFRSALHVDEKGSGTPETVSEFIRSDTISAAVSIAWAKLFPEDSPAVFSNPPFRLSSAFPFIGDILLFPVPVWGIWKQADDPEKRKDIKKIKWLSLSLLEQVLAGAILSVDDCQIMPCGISITRDELTRNKALTQFTEPWKLVERQRVAVDRLNTDPSTDESQGRLFFFAMQFFAEESGLFLIADGGEKDIKRLRAVLDFLGDEGMGADRSSGLGSFKVTHSQTFSVNSPKKTDGWFTLSLFNPKPDENLEKLLMNSGYSLVTRSGWISGSTYGRAPIKTFGESSFFSDKPDGRTVSVLNPDLIEHLGHDVFRDFRTLSIPCVKPDKL